MENLPLVEVGSYRLRIWASACWYRQQPDQAHATVPQQKANHPIHRFSASHNVFSAYIADTIRSRRAGNAASR